MMQTVSIEDLRDNPLQTLWYLHIQPPIFDGMRALLCVVHYSQDSVAMLRQVDQSIYMLWAMVFGLTGFIVFWWLSQTCSLFFSAICAVIFLAHPATIMYATLLETTMLSAFLILYFCYLLWRIYVGTRVSAILLALAFLALFFTRSIFFWPWLFVIAGCLLCLQYPLRKLLVFLAITGLVVGLYTSKQIVLFNISATSSFTGLSLANSIGMPDGRSEYFTQVIPLNDSRNHIPAVLGRTRKVDGSPNFNHQYYLSINAGLQKKYYAQLAQDGYKRLFAYIYNNLQIYWLPSSRYTPHVIVDHLPQRNLYDAVFSYPLFPTLLLLGLIIWLIHTGKDKASLLRGLGLLMPVALVALICIVFDRGENLRFKYFIEPVLFVFIARQFYVAGSSLKVRVLKPKC